MEIFIALQLTIIIYFLYDVGNSLRSISESFTSLTSAYSATEEEYNKVSSYDIEREKRELEFDERIRQMQLELDSQILSRTSSNTNSGEAEILANGIYNIPHNEIKTFSDVQEEEIAN